MRMEVSEHGSPVFIRAIRVILGLFFSLFWIAYRVPKQFEKKVSGTVYSRNCLPSSAKNPLFYGEFRTAGVTDPFAVTSIGPAFRHPGEL